MQSQNITKGMELPDIIKTIFNSIIDLGGVFYCGGVLTMVDSPYCLKKSGLYCLLVVFVYYGKRRRIKQSPITNNKIISYCKIGDCVSRLGFNSLYK